MWAERGLNSGQGGGRGGEEESDYTVYQCLQEASTCDMESKPSPHSRNHLYLSVLILNGLYLICGTTFAWSSPVLEKLNLEASVGSSIASMLSLGSIFGPILSGIVLDPLGRRGTVALSMTLMTSSYVLLTLASTVLQLSIGRFLAGLTAGIAFSAVPLYIAEISEDEVRGLLNTLSQISCCSGSLLVYSVGPFVSYTTLHYAMLALCCAFFLLLPFLPQSPYSLVAKGQVESARETLVWLREGRMAAAVDKEFQLILDTIEQNKSEKVTFTDLFKEPGNRKALVLCCMLLVLQQVSGISIVFFYAQTIFRLTGTAIESSTCSIVVGVIMTVSSFFCPIAVDRFGYKKPLLASAAGMAMGMGGLGVFFMLKDNGIDVDDISFMPLLSIVTYIVFFNSGFCNIPWALSGELFPTSLKPAATTVIASTCGLVAFLSTNLFTDLIDLLGLDMLFMACSFFCCIAVVFVTLVVQDTSGLSFVEIKKVVAGSKRREILAAREMAAADDSKL